MRKSQYARRDDIPPGMADLAERRTNFLFEVMRSHNTVSIRSVIISAYLQGLEDCFETVSAHPAVIGEPPYYGA